MTRYLVIETAYLGDVIISLGVARAIKENDSGAHVVYLVRPDASQLTSACPDVDRVVTFDKRGEESGTSGLRKKASELDSMLFDVIIVLHQSHRTRSLVERIAAARKIGFKGDDASVLTDSVEDTGWHTRYERALLPLRAIFGSELPLSTLPRLDVSPVARVDAFTARWPNPIIIAPGSAWTTKRWPASRFLQLATELAEQGHGLIIIGGKDETGIGEAISNVGEHVLDLTGTATLLESAYAISRSKLLVCNDSSPLHLAVAVGTQTVAIFGPTLPEFGFAPPNGSGLVVEQPTWCRPCTSHGSGECPIHTHECMEGISVEQVREAIGSVLGSFGSA